MKNLQIVLLFTVFVQSYDSVASPTDSDFEICEKIKQEIIKRCNLSTQEECNLEAGSHYAKCIASVKQQFNDESPKKIAEQKKARLIHSIKKTLPIFWGYPAIQQQVQCTSAKKCADAEIVKTVKTQKAFKIAEHETTIEAFTIFVEDTGYVTDAEKNSGHFLACNLYPKDIQDMVGIHKNWLSPGFAQGNKHPVVCVSYQDIQAYIQWLNSKTNKKYRLPTREEWLAVYASKSPKNCADAGVGLVDEHCAGTYGTFQVKNFSANSFKLFDMNGNVQEWVDSCVDDCNKHLILGDSINHAPSQFNPCEDNNQNNDFRSPALGFRLAIDAFDD